MNSHLGFPDEKTMSEEQGLVENHHYRDLRYYDLSDFDRICSDEQDLLDYEGDLGSDDFQDNEVYFMGLDPGVASTVVALAALGACPVSSCCGGLGHHESHPLVYFWCSEQQYPIVKAAAEEAGVHLDGIGSPGMLVWHEHDLGAMRSFAQAVVSRLQEER